MIMRVDKWDVYQLELTPEKLDNMWATFQKYKSLFSDHNRNDKEGWIQYLLSPDTYWLEIKEGDMSVGLIYFEGFSKGIEIIGHMVYYDRKPAEKLEVTRGILGFMFENFPIQRIVVEIPEMYRATDRLLIRLGFRKEGKKRQAVLLGGTWKDTFLYGLLRSDLWVALEKQSVG